MQKITIERTTAPKAKPTDETKLGFGKIFTDHMFIMNYDECERWHNPRARAGMIPESFPMARLS